MKRKRIDKDLERKIILACIVSRRMLGAMDRLGAADILPSELSKVVLRWCVDYYQKHGEAPGGHIQDIFRRERKRIQDDDLLDLLETFLQGLSDDAEQTETLNEDFLLRQAVTYLQERSMKILAADIHVHLDNHEPEKAKELLQSHSLPDLMEEETVHLFNDADAIREAWEQQEEPLFQFRGALGSLINPYLVKGGFLGVMGPEKIGKTFFLVAMALKALAFRKKVVFFGVGDMSRNQMIRRMLITITGKSDQERYCRGVEVPVAGRYVEIEGKEEPVLEVETETAPDCRPLTWREGWRRARAFKKIMRKGEFRLVCYPTESVNVQDLRGLCRKWRQESGFIPDVVILDYADILAPEPGMREYRHQQNSTWKALRNWSLDGALGQPLVITATQSDAQSYEVRTLRRKNFSEDKRKFSHVTGMLSLNQTMEEKLKQVVRIGWILLREGDFTEGLCCTCLQCLRKGKFILQSFWKDSEED